MTRRRLVDFQLLPTTQALDVRRALTDYLSTTFALADSDAQAQLAAFVDDGEGGVFRGLFVRARMPFEPAAGTREFEWNTAGFTPYGHQAAAFERLDTRPLTRGDFDTHNWRPRPTIVTTGTGSGKTEAFLHPIIDHCLRARHAGQRGTKAIILYPMNALANDQARRLAELITGSAALRGITAALYTGETDTKRTSVTDTGLISDRHIIRDNPPDILLTNYKMLDQLLLRPDDHPLWERSALSLQFLVLDEFHTYDGAQGTDVAMLLRRLGLALKNNCGNTEHTGLGAPITDADRARPLGFVTPIATSATLGDDGNTQPIRDFARTVFGEHFPPQSVITETRMSADEWRTTIAAPPAGAQPTPRESILLQDPPGASTPPTELARRVVAALYDHVDDANNVNDGAVPSLLAHHPLVAELLEHLAAPIDLGQLAAQLFPGKSLLQARDFVAALIAALSHVRATQGRSWPTIEAHLWVREPSRINRAVSATPAYHFSDDGELTDTPVAPAVYCRNCGRSGWGVRVSDTSDDVDTDASVVRTGAMTDRGRFRAMIYAPTEADQAADADPHRTETDPTTRLAYYDAVASRLLSDAPGSTDDSYLQGLVLPVLVLTGKDARANAKRDMCPSCEATDAIRFVGSAVTTLASVTLSTLFAAPHLDVSEKKALMFTDSVQDAAHRAGFVQSRSHSMTQRSTLHQAIGDDAARLTDVVDRALDHAGTDPEARYRLVPPALADDDLFRNFWADPTGKGATRGYTERVRSRLLFDLILEIGLNSKFGRTLEQTGAVVAEVDCGTPQEIAAIARAAHAEALNAAMSLEFNAPEPDVLRRWVRGVIEHMRREGGIFHPWFKNFVAEDCRRYRLWGGRVKHEGMPAFPPGRATPGMPRVGGKTPAGKDLLYDQVTSRAGWYVRWTRQTLGLPAEQATHAARSLFIELAKAGVLGAHSTETQGVVYTIPTDGVRVAATSDESFTRGDYTVRCSVCRTWHYAGRATTTDLDGAPCMSPSCAGTLTRAMPENNYYRELYRGHAGRRLVAREHTSVLPDKVRISHERAFKASDTDPSAPNVLVATPTLEMGIDIGDLSTVFLASLPRTVASYTQRVGRAGRHTGNALNLAFVRGRGENLARLAQPLSLIGGAVVPPATYLSAEEILRRQFVAYCCDLVAADPQAPQPRSARDLMSDVERGSFFGHLIAFHQRGHARLLDEFLGAFTADDGTALLKPAAHEALRAWATPDADGNSGMRTRICDATHAWGVTCDELRRRSKEIRNAMPELEEAASAPGATDDERRAPRNARAALACVRRELKDLTTRHWVAVAEAAGLLPNYTLLGDTVELEVAVTVVEAETGNYRSVPHRYVRASGNALREFAPGATFYVNQLAVKVDSVDLGPGGENVYTRAFCPECGFNTGEHAGLMVCPRCGSTDIADADQRLRVVELHRVSAEVRAEEARITDSHEDRQQPFFTMVGMADIDPAAVRDAWFVDGSEFAVKYLENVALRWVNLGAGGDRGLERRVNGQTLNAGMFRLCDSCGHVDSSTGSNHWRDHKPWCRHRNATGEHNVDIALTRSLVTQGLLLRLPQSVTAGDSYAVPSLTAAVRMGLTDHFGGNPGHLSIMATRDPAGPTAGGQCRDALLLHDVVPGGSGYLTDLAEPDALWALLYGAWKRLRSCACAAEQLRACHECLLPHAPGSASDLLSRMSAERHLRTLLGIETNPDDEFDAEAVGDAMGWHITREETAGEFSTETPLEQQFRLEFRHMCEQLGAKVWAEPGSRGNTEHVQIPDSHRMWALRPQEMLDGCQPDFVLRCTDTNVPPVAIFIDGRAYHATRAHNRLADDMAKREALREVGEYYVLSLTAADLGENRVVHAMPALDVLDMQGNHRPETVAALRQPMEWLRAWVSDADVAGLRSLSEWVPRIAVAGGQHVLDSGVAVTELALRERLGEGGERVQGQPQLRVTSAGYVTIVGRMTAVGGSPSFDIAVVLDDRDAALDDPAFVDSWRHWLALRNAVQDTGDDVRFVTVSALEAEFARQVDREVAAGGPQVRVQLSGRFAENLSYLDEAEQQVVALIETIVGEREPEFGEEIGDGVPVDLSWPTAKVAVIFDADEDDLAELRAAGWRVFTGAEADFETQFRQAMENV